MTLEELIAKATPLPWKPGLREPDTEKRKANELLFIHTTNMLPKLVAVMKIVLPQVECKWDEGNQVCSVCGAKVWKYGHDEDCELKKLMDLLVEADNVKEWS